jgi:hypothetical protein
MFGMITLAHFWSPAALLLVIGKPDGFQKT